MSPPDLARFLAQDFDRLLSKHDALLRRCRALDGQRLYITGGTGFFGRSLLALMTHLHRCGIRFEVDALSRDPARFLDAEPWAGAEPWLRLHTGSVSSRWPSDGRYGLLLHAATDTHASAHQDLSSVFDGLLAGGRQAVDFCERHGVARTLLTGSGAQFGALPPSLTNGVPDDSPLACDPTRPGSAYGEGKRAVETMFALHAQQQGTAVIPTRCFAFVGPGLPLDGHFAIGNFLRDALDNKPIRLRSAGQAVRSYLYGADLAMWLLLLLLDGDAGRPVNVGSDQGLRIAELAHRVAARVQPGLPVILGELQPGEERQFYLPSIANAHAQGLRVWTPLEMAIDRTAQWHRERRP